MEEDGDFEVVEVTKSASRTFDGLNDAVDRFGDTVGDTGLEEVEDVVLVGFDGA